jgi:hypothetical protein
MHTPETIQAVFHALVDPAADLSQAAQQLGLSLPELLEIAESPQVTAAIEALEKLAAIRARAVTALAAHTALAALAHIAASDAQTPGGVETRRKAASQILRMHAETTRPDDHLLAGDAPSTPSARGHNRRAPEANQTSHAEPIDPAAAHRPPPSPGQRPPASAPTASGPLKRTA